MAKKRRATSISQSRLTASQVEQQRKRTQMWFIGGAVVLTLTVLGLFYLGYQEQAAANTTIEGMVTLPDAGRGHEDGDLQYTNPVPASGAHNPNWLNCGIYDQPVRRENVLHSMEHGAVWIAYQRELPAAEVDTLQNIVREERAKRGEALVVLAPQPDLHVPIVATAWRVQLELEDASDERLRLFLDRYQRGPFYPEPGASCTFGGIGEPIL